MMNQPYTNLTTTRREVVSAHPSQAGSRIWPLDDGNWRAVWRGHQAPESFRSRQTALGWLERCDRSGQLVPV